MKQREKLQSQVEELQRQAEQKQQVEEENAKLKEALSSLSREKEALLAEILSLRSGSLNSSTNLSGSHLSDLPSPHLGPQPNKSDLSLEVFPALEVKKSASQNAGPPVPNGMVFAPSSQEVAKSPDDAAETAEQLASVLKYTPTPIPDTTLSTNYFDQL